MSEPEIPAPKSRRNWGGLAVAAVIGVVVGVGASTLVWTLAGGSVDPAEGDEGDVATACSLVRRTTWERTDDRGLITDFGRWGAAAQLVGDVASRDAQYSPLAEALDESRQALAREMKLGDAYFEQQVQTARALCEDL
jgi:hypothetical protein